MVDFYDVSPDAMAGVPLGVDPVAHMRACAPLPLHAEEYIDRAVTPVALERLAILDYLIGKGLTYPITDWLGIMNIRWQKSNKTGNPQFSMYPEPDQVEERRPDLGLDSLPVYCLTDGFSIHPRLFAEWERTGFQSMDTTMIQDSIRRENEALELSVIEGPRRADGSQFKVNGQAIPGLLTDPNASQFAFDSNLTWTDAAKDPTDIIGDVRAARAMLKANGRYGPYVLIIGTDYDDVLDADYKTTASSVIMTTRERIMKLSGIQDIIISDRFPASRAVLLQPTNNVIDIVIGQQPAVVSWITGPAALPVRKWMTVACVIPRIKQTYEGQSGIVVMKPNLGDPNLPS